jgi:hypothetical protein
MLAQERRQNLVFPYPPLSRISRRPAWSFQTTPEPLPCFAAFEYPNGGIGTPPCAFEPPQKVVLDETGKIEETAHVRITESALKGGSVRITPEFILMNADHPGHFPISRGAVDVLPPGEPRENVFR